MSSQTGSISIAEINYMAYEGQDSEERVGRLSVDGSTVVPLSFKSGTPIGDLYQVIEAGAAHVVPSGEPIPVSRVKILPPLRGRDVLAVGKNYAEHAVEFNKSGYDSSDKVDQPTHPVIFTKRATSIIANGEAILPHSHFTKTLDYEGEIGVIVGKSGFQISEADAMEYVWGYTIINDVTARERQRDHKQFYIGKSADTYCPMGPVAVPKEALPEIMRVQTYVNGEKRQDATIQDLIFSVPFLIETISEGQTLRPSDVLATGTPAGVGFGLKPPTFLQPNDTVQIQVTGLGALTNKVASESSPNPTPARIQRHTTLVHTNTLKSKGTPLTNINGKQLHYINKGAPTGQPIVFIHGLGGTIDFWTPLLMTAGLQQTHPLHLFDLEGHGLSPTSPLSALSISSLSTDLSSIFSYAHISSSTPAILIAHSMGCLIALSFALAHPTLVDKMILLGPPPSPLPPAASTNLLSRASTVRTAGGMSAVADQVATSATSVRTRGHNPLAFTAARLSLLGQDPEGYAKACTALAASTDSALDVERLSQNVLIITGDEDKVGPPDVCREFHHKIPNARDPVVLEDVGHWHVFEDCSGVAAAVEAFLRE